MEVDEKALKWDALHKLSNYDQPRKSILNEVCRDRQLHISTFIFH